MTVLEKSDLRALGEKSRAGGALSREEARAVLNWPENELLDVVAEAHRVRHQHFGQKVKMNFLVNLQSGLCPEDCSYCSQSKDSKAPVEKYRLLSSDDVLDQADRAVAAGAARLCLVAAMRGPGEREMASLDETVRKVKEKYPRLEVCASMGLLKEGQAGRLKSAGVDAYNHNLNTSERHYEEICRTHTHSDRLDTIEKAKAAGLSPCSGAIFGMGETQDDIIDVAFRLREVGADSIPINFLIPVPGTAMARHNQLSPTDCLKILCLFRFVNPSMEIRIAGGRERHLRSLQALGLYVANSIFIGDYLTTKGQAASADRQMILDMGFEIEGEDNAPGSPTRPLPDPVEMVTRATRQ
ncbi:MAG: biotin synthase BioB [Elusimicrobia bacterium]|nr:biotin synthase BioB [Elusimicrobiota bacterium]MBP9698590.1 biotin synthase BioB [Elusimicrobiota bacterium]